MVTLTGYAVHPWSPQSQVTLYSTKEPGDFPRYQPNILDIEFGYHSTEAAVCHLDIMEEEQVRWACLSALKF